MATVALGVIWLSYAAFTYGYATVRSCNVRFRDVALPGGWLGATFTGCHPDSGAAAATKPKVTTGHSGTAGGIAGPGGASGSGWPTKAACLAGTKKIVGPGAVVSCAQGANGRWFGRVVPVGH